jgi:hypothetical protein
MYIIDIIIIIIYLFHVAPYWTQDIRETPFHFSQ